MWLIDSLLDLLYPESNYWAIFLSTLFLGGVCYLDFTAYLVTQIVYSCCFFSYRYRNFSLEFLGFEGVPSELVSEILSEMSIHEKMKLREVDK
jgi:hypothetical protein